MVLGGGYVSARFRILLEHLIGSRHKLERFKILDKIFKGYMTPAYMYYLHEKASCTYNFTRTHSQFRGGGGDNICTCTFLVCIELSFQ